MEENVPVETVADGAAHIRQTKQEDVELAQSLPDITDISMPAVSAENYEITDMELGTGTAERKVLAKCGGYSYPENDRI